MHASKQLVSLGPLLLALGAACRSAPARLAELDDGFTREFPVEATDWCTSVRNRYFVLEPGYRLVLENPVRKLRLEIRVLDETLLVDGVRTRVVEERETRGGVPIEISRNYFAASKRTHNVYYFGEDVDVYRDGALASHEGSWRAGVDGARYGLAMPGDAQPGARFYQELAPGMALDRSEIRSAVASIQTPAGVFERCLDVEESSPLEPGALESKIYAPDIGLVQDEGLLLCEYGFATERR